jgi:membrane-bound lytic murein transglycosylase B
MLSRRIALSSLLSAAALPASAATGTPFPSFLSDMRAEARNAGISTATIDRAFAGLAPNQKVIDKDRHQPESTMTWARYRALVITDKRIADGRNAYAAHRALLAQVRDRFAVDPRVIAAIWGVESGFGAVQGDYRVIESLATLAWDGRRAALFKGELIAALKILDHGDISPAKMLGSYAGAMGQPQFMPSSYLRYAVDFQGTGRRDIWSSTPDVLGSIANYLAQSGWRAERAWGQQVVVPQGTETAGKRSVADWAKAGVRPLAGRWAEPPEAPAAIITPDGPSGDAFATFANFAAIRRYNASDYYAAAVGLIGDQVVA